MAILKSNKVTGSDNINAKFYKAGGTFPKIQMGNLIVKIWDAEAIP